jgi:hypothetical protein
VSAAVDALVSAVRKAAAMKKDADTRLAIAQAQQKGAAADLAAAKQALTDALERGTV